MTDSVINIDSLRDVAMASRRQTLVLGVHNSLSIDDKQE